MINLKVAVEDTLQRLPKTERKILMLVFIDGIKSESAAELMWISLRTFFRKKAKGLECFQEKLIEYGYNIPGTCRKVQDRVKAAVENMTGLMVTDVDIRIASVEMQKR